jgi:hypothetical protein
MASANLHGLTIGGTSSRTLTVKHDTLTLILNKLPTTRNSIQCVGAMAYQAYSTLGTNSDDTLVTQYQLHVQVLWSLIQERRKQQNLPESPYGARVFKIIHLVSSMRAFGMPTPGLRSHATVNPVKYEDVFGAWSPEQTRPELLSPVYNEHPELFPRVFPLVMDERL